MKNKFTLLEHRDIPENLWERFWFYFYMFFLYLMIPVIIFYLIQWDPITDYNIEDSPLRPMITFLVLAWMPSLYYFRKNRALVKAQQQEISNLKIELEKSKEELKDLTSLTKEIVDDYIYNN